MRFEGTAVAMVTPMHEDGSIDEEGYRQNINWLIEQDVDGEKSLTSWLMKLTAE